MPHRDREPGNIHLFSYSAYEQVWAPITQKLFNQGVHFKGIYEKSFV